MQGKISNKQYQNGPVSMGELAYRCCEAYRRACKETDPLLQKLKLIVPLTEKKNLHQLDILKKRSLQLQVHTYKPNVVMNQQSGRSYGRLIPPGVLSWQECYPS